MVLVYPGIFRADLFANQSRVLSLLYPAGNLKNDAPQQGHHSVPNVLRALAPSGPHGGFTHPGTLMGPNEVKLLRQRASGEVQVDQTWRSALEVRTHFASEALHCMILHGVDVIRAWQLG